MTIEHCWFVLCSNYVVTVWGGCFVDNGTRDVCIFCWGQEQFSGIMGTNEVLLLPLLLCYQVVPDTFYIDRD